MQSNNALLQLSGNGVAHDLGNSAVVSALASPSTKRLHDRCGHDMRASLLLTMRMT
jgi:hypothetical protein